MTPSADVACSVSSMAKVTPVRNTHGALQDTSMARSSKGKKSSLSVEVRDPLAALREEASRMDGTAIAQVATPQNQRVHGFQHQRSSSISSLPDSPELQPLQLGNSSQPVAVTQLPVTQQSATASTETGGNAVLPLPAPSTPAVSLPAPNTTPLPLHAPSEPVGAEAAGNGKSLEDYGTDAFEKLTKGGGMKRPASAKGLKHHSSQQPKPRPRYKQKPNPVSKTSPKLLL